MNAVPSLKLLRQSQADEYWPLDKQRLLAIHQRLKLTCTPPIFYGDVRRNGVGIRRRRRQMRTC